jgi:hypothetical protein
MMAILHPKEILSQPNRGPPCGRSVMICPSGSPGAPGWRSNIANRGAEDNARAAAIVCVDPARAVSKFNIIELITTSEIERAYVALTHPVASGS